MTDYQKQLLGNYLTHLTILGDNACYDSFDQRYQELRFAQGLDAPRSLAEASDLRYKDILPAARVFNASLLRTRTPSSIRWSFPSTSAGTAWNTATFTGRWPPAHESAKNGPGRQNRGQTPKIRRAESRNAPLFPRGVVLGILATSTLTALANVDARKHIFARR